MPKASKELEAGPPTESSGSAKVGRLSAGGKRAVAEGKDPATGRFLPGNQFWRARSSAGRKPKFTEPEALWAACCEYFEWVEAHPLWEDKLVTFQGAATHEPIAKMRAMTLTGLLLFLDVSDTAWAEWRKERPDLAGVIARVEGIIYEQKFTGAAADLFNANIISRELGLADRTEHTAKHGGAVRFIIED